MSKKALVTGASRGLGKGFVEYLLSEGFEVFAGIRNIEKIDPNLKSNPNFHPISLDVTSDESIQSAFKRVSQSTDHLDLLINNAGNNKDSATGGKKELVSNLKDLNRKYLLDMFNVNSISPMIVTKEFVTLLDVSSFVINITSCRASFHDEFENSTANYGYRASKIALNMMTFASTQDLEDIKTFCVHPGSVLSDMNPEGTQLPIDQAKQIIDITRNWKDEFNGKFFRYDGSLYSL